MATQCLVRKNPNKMDPFQYPQVANTLPWYDTIFQVLNKPIYLKWRFTIIIIIIIIVIMYYYVLCISFNYVLLFYCICMQRKKLCSCHHLLLFSPQQIWTDWRKLPAKFSTFLKLGKCGLTQAH